jgi:hypothetical protein
LIGEPSHDLAASRNPVLDAAVAISLHGLDCSSSEPALQCLASGADDFDGLSVAKMIAE